MQTYPHARPMRNIASEVSNVERRLQALGGAASVEQLGVVGSAIASLREAYQRNPREFAEFLPRLAAVRRRFETVLTGRMLDAVDRFHAVSRQIHEAEREREFWRQYLVAQTRGEASIRFEGRESYAQVRAAASRSLPAAGSDERAALEEALDEAGCLKAVSYISPVKLHSELVAGRIPSDAAKVVEAVCPASRRHTVISRPRSHEEAVGNRVA